MHRSSRSIVRVLSIARVLSALILIQIPFIQSPTVYAQELIETLPKIRSVAPAVADLVPEGVQRSESFAALVRRLEFSDVLVMVHCMNDWNRSSAGRLMFLARTPNHRYLSIQIACDRAADGEPALTRDMQLALLGHELQHAVEIAEAADVVDDRSLTSLFARIGMDLSDGGARRFDTSAAREAGRQVLAELLAERFGVGQLSRTPAATGAFASPLD